MAECIPIPDFPTPAVGTVFTPALAEQAVRELPMPQLPLRVQPGGPTLVNADTIFYTEAQPLNTSFDLLGHTIEIVARPVVFRWVYGDGAQTTTRTPGRPYPHKDVTHRYMQPASKMAARVDTTWAVRYSIDGGGLTDLGDDLTSTGTTTPIQVREAMPVLVR